jgi:hypothetical protein
VVTGNTTLVENPRDFAIPGDSGGDDVVALRGQGETQQEKAKTGESNPTFHKS